MWAWLKAKLLYLYTSCHGSQTIIWARLQVLFGSILSAIQFIDPNLLGLKPQYVMWWTVANGALSEYLRRRNAVYTPAFVSPEGFTSSADATAIATAEINHTLGALAPAIAPKVQ